jgi:hypothetical protein
MIWRCGVILVSAAALAGCHPGQKAGHGEVSGQILPGSVSDAMLPYDSVKSKAPLAPREADDNPSADTTADSADLASSGASAAPDIAASPAPAAPAVVN